MKGRIFKISRFSLNDGPGIHTTVFLSGCNLRYKWCHNPEGLDINDGYEMEDKEIINIVKKDLSFYNMSGGGMTLSGGEPLLQSEFCTSLLSSAKALNINTAVETSLCIPLNNLSKITELTDVFLADYKHYDKTVLSETTGVNTEIIYKNAEYLNSKSKPVILRCPIIPTVNDLNKHFDGIISFASNHANVIEINLLPYHDFGLSKYEHTRYTPHIIPLPIANKPYDFRCGAQCDTLYYNERRR